MRVLCDSSCDSCIQACPNITLDGKECENSFCDVTLSSSTDLKIATFLTVVDTTTTQSFSDGTNQVTVQGYGFEETSDYDTDYVIVLSTSTCFNSTTLTNVSLCNQSALCNDNGLCSLCASIDIDLTNCGDSSLSNSSEYEVTASITYGVGGLDYSMSGVIGTVQAVLDTRTTSLLIESNSTRVTLSGTGFINENASVYEAQFKFMDSVRCVRAWSSRILLSRCNVSIIPFTQITRISLVSLTHTTRKSPENQCSNGLDVTKTQHQRSNTGT